MLGCEELIFTERISRKRRLGVMILDVTSSCRSDERDLGLEEFVNLDGNIKRCLHAYHPSRYALASR